MACGGAPDSPSPWRIGSNHLLAARDLHKSGSCGSDDRLARIAARSVERVVDLSILPEAMQQNCELPGHGHHSSLLGVLASPFGQHQPPGAQLAFGAEGTEDVLSGVDQQTSEIGIAGLGDAQLGVAGAGLICSGAEPNCGAHLTAL